MDYSKLTKEQIIDGIKNNTINFRYLTESWRDDKDIVLEAINQRGVYLEYASKNLRNDKEVVLEAIKNNWLSLRCASENLKDDKDCLELIEKIDIIQWPLVHKKWFKERMDVLDSLREKELMEKSIIHNNISSKKIKF